MGGSSRRGGCSELDRTFYVHLETRQSSWENPYELIMANLSLEAELSMSSSLFSHRWRCFVKPSTWSRRTRRAGRAPRLAFKSSRSPAICSVQSWRESEASEELAEQPVEVPAIKCRAL